MTRRTELAEASDVLAAQLALNFGSSWNRPLVAHGSGKLAIEPALKIHNVWSGVLAALWHLERITGTLTVLGGMRHPGVRRC